MLSKKFDPLKGKILEVLNYKGEIVDEKLVPKLDDDKLIEMYKTMLLGRIADIKALQYQRQGRMLTYAPIKGQEAAQVGVVAALEQQDWMVPAFREMAGMLYRGASLKQLYLYWYGNEEGSRFEKDVRILPISVPIASQINHGAGVAYASKILDKKEVVVAYVGDGGTSHGEFHEGVNFAAVLDLPLIVIIQNNQWAISTPRETQTKAKTLAQKAVGYGIPGIQVDGNDPLAMYIATEEAKKRALKGEGPTIIEALTYRLGPHTTSDDPTIYRDQKEVDYWEERDPLKRFKIYLINKGLWSEEQEEKETKEVTDYVNKTFKEVEATGLIDLEETFKYTYAEMTPDLQEQLDDYKAYLKEVE
ncbi:pyruvate dehydrogenase (acetyl-transferring) E1 component subunit alpha [Candidatus Xianfuyuplasma coldseepsis]|uniref:Pyruvate dehydrogenase E1 component subunit alpha n=1 Tax=Candidatus Xianfuyuplasma coldseepsis TaxID=2782163 RepID=A0A7L7KQK3_9MOLU|nr:pyruvate dehydrogenase (acetyl-transferring) E1 component subunit alpha [Xianfuyuplasma coldseepsis]QMS84506.1 pyruvate dehydrogenase (acetyl-transferring) E1 component subunit alpha [Xianfuyuplasma coldseepsis]